MDSGLEDRKLQRSTGTSRGNRCVRGVVRIRGGRPEGEDQEIAKHEQDGEAPCERPPAAPEPAEHPGGRESDEAGNGQLGDREEPLRDSRIAEWRHVAPERLVDREVGADGEQDGHEKSDHRECRERAAAPPEDDQPGERDDRDEPADVDLLLEPAEAEPIEEIAPPGLEHLHLVEAAPAAAENRVVDHGLLERDRDRRPCERPCEHPEHGLAPVPDGGIEHRQRQSSECQVHLAREWQRDEGDGSERTPELPTPRCRGTARSLDRPERDGERYRHPSEQVADAALREPIRSDREDEPPERRRERAQTHSGQPCVRRQACQHDAREQEDVPRDDRPEQRVERPEGQSVRPAGEHELRVDERLEAERVAPRGAPLLELMADEPEPVDGLEVVAGGRFTVARPSAGDERRAETSNRGRGRQDGRDRVQARREEAGAGQEVSDALAESSSSTSGTCVTSYRHAPRMMPSPPTRKALRTTVSLIPRNSPATPKARTASPFQSERSGKSRPRTSRHALCE